MSLVSIGFLIFFSLAVVLYYAVPEKYRYTILLFVNYIFYASWDIRYLVFLGIVTVSTYICGLYVYKKKSILVLCMGLNLFLLTCFRFNITKVSLIIPLGFSFYCLQALGYLIDVYKGKTSKEKNIIKYAVYVSFFSTIISGPIERSDNLLKQIQERNGFVYEKAKRGILYILYGYFLKVLIADRISAAVSPIYLSFTEYEGATLLMATIFYGIQLYADFAGYSYIAIGMAKILGFELVENFKQPYFAKNIKEFWKRWHISLSQWLKEYVYIPLGGNRCSKIRNYCNLILTFLISGIWHGSGIKFIVWGLLHGIYQVIGNVTLEFEKNIEEKLKIKTQCWSYRFAKVTKTFLLVNFAWIFFCANSFKDAIAIVLRIVCNFNLGRALVLEELFLGINNNLFGVLIVEIIILVIVDFLHEKKISIITWLDTQNCIFRWMVYYVLVIAVMVGMLYSFGTNSSNFIYTQF